MACSERHVVCAGRIESAAAVLTGNVDFGVCRYSSRCAEPLREPQTVPVWILHVELTRAQL
jgi:hypothetical protein